MHSSTSSRTPVYSGFNNRNISFSQTTAGGLFRVGSAAQLCHQEHRPLPFCHPEHVGSVWPHGHEVTAIAPSITSSHLCLQEGRKGEGESGPLTHLSALGLLVAVPSYPWSAHPIRCSNFNDSALPGTYKCPHSRPDPLKNPQSKTSFVLKKTKITLTV